MSLRWLWGRMRVWGRKWCVWLSLDVCALGLCMLSKLLVGLGVGADVLADADSYVELEAPGLWFLLSDVLFCSRSRLAKLSVSAQHISCS